MIRQARLEDLENVTNIIVDSWKNAYKGILEDDYLDNISYKDNYNKIKTHFKNNDIFVNEDDETKKIDGIIAIGNRRDADKQGAEIYSLYVTMEKRGHTIGTKLVNKIKEHFKNLGYSSVYVWCIAKNDKAKEFYQKTGAKFMQKRITNIGNEKIEEVLFVYNL